jgi:hypothetical protein
MSVGRLEGTMRLQDIFTDESRWTKGAAARDINGNIANCLFDDAVSFCIYGALGKSDPDTFGVDSEIKIRRYLYDIGYIGGIAMFNDDPNTTFEDIRKMVETLDI